MNYESLENAAAKYAPVVLSIVRIMVALLLLQHGLSKFFGFPVASSRPALFALTWFAGLIEIVGGTLLLVGFLTRPVAFILAGELAFAYFIGHAPRSSIRSAMAVRRQCCSASSSSIWRLRAAGR